MIFPSSDVRASDAERERMVEFLKAHYAAGRLDEAEFSARTSAAYRAVHVSQLDALARDLPPLAAAVAARPRPSRGVMSAPLVTMALLAVGVVAVMTSLPAEAVIPLVFLAVPMILLLLVVVAPFALPVIGFVLLARMASRAPHRSREQWRGRSCR